jgi:arsenate reductase (thioredoxin)
MLERFRAVRDQIEMRMREWLEHPEEELRKLREERERERRERLEAETRAGAASQATAVGDGAEHDPFRRA